jgi:hypothetical protein
MSSGEAPTVAVARLNERDREILTGHFPAYHITTHEALRRARWSDVSIDAVKKWTMRMRDGGWIAEAPLWSESSVYFRLTEQTTQHLQLPNRLSRPLSPVALARTYGALSFCILGDRRFRRLTQEEFAGQFPPLVSAHMQNDWYYVDPDFEDQHWPKSKRLGYLYADTSQRVRDILRAYHRVLGQRQRHNAWYHDVIRPGRFIFAVVTTCLAKRAQILSDLGSPQKIPIRVEVRPDFFHVMPQRKREGAET